MLNDIDVEKLIARHQRIIILYDLYDLKLISYYWRFLKRSLSFLLSSIHWQKMVPKVLMH